MKTYPLLILAACASFALGSCATSSGLTTSTENDGVYYSSKDQTTLTPEAQQALSYNQSASSEETGDINPEYSSANGTAGSASSTEYYDDGYSYAARLRRFNQPTYNGLGLGYYGMAYTDPFYYGGYSPYGYSPYYGSGLYDPFYSPYYGYGSGLSLSFGLGLGSLYRPYGFNPYYGSAFYDPFYSSYYGYGGYGYGLGGGWGGYYSPAYYGGGYGYGNSTGERYSRNARTTARRDRSAEALSSNPATRAGRLGNMSPNTGSGNVVVDNGNGVNNGNNGAVYGSRGRIIQRGQAATTQQQQNATLGIPADQPTISTGGRGSRWRVLDQNRVAQPGSNVNTGAVAAPDRRSRGRFFDNSGQSQQQQQTFSRPSRSFEQQQPSRSFEQPSRSFSSPSSSPSFSAPSGGGGSRGRVR